MAKEAVNPRKTKSSLRSIKEVPFTKEEIKEMETIQEQPYWARKSLKEQFCDGNNRLIKEVDEYFKTHRKPPIAKGQRGQKKNDSTIGKPSSIRAPREQVIQPLEIDSSRGTPSNTIRVKWKSITIEGEDIIFEF